MMKVLIETRMNSLKLNESKAPKKGCLGRLEGVCADFKNPTRNGRMYPLELWKKVFNDSLFKESLENKTLFGELDHPEDRFEPLISQACVVMTDYRIDEDAGLIYGGFDILDTPSGRILKSIVDYGSVVGVSSRGQGDIVETSNGQKVDEDSYEFACFDVVSTPAVEKARQNVMESMKHIKTQSFEESIKKQIDDAESVADLNIIRSVVRTSNLNDSEIDSLIESIEDRCVRLQNVGETISTKKTDTDAKNNDTTLESAKTIRENKELYQCIKDLKKKVSAYKHRESRYLESLSRRDEDVKKLQSQVEMFKKKTKEQRTHTQSVRESMDKRLFDYKLQLNKAAVDNKTITEQSESLQEKVQRMRERISTLSEQVSELTSKNEQLQNTYRSKMDEKEKVLRESQTDFDSVTRELESVSKELKECRQDYDSRISHYSQLLTEATEQSSEDNDTIATLTEQLDNAKSTIDKLKKQVKSYQTKYVETVSKINGLESKIVSESVTMSTTPQQVDGLVKSIRESIDRKNKLGISSHNIADGDSYIVESLQFNNTRKPNEEDQQLDDFLTRTLESL